MATAPLTFADMFNVNAKLAVPQLKRNFIDPSVLELLIRCLSNLNEKESVGFLDEYLLKAAEIVTSINYTDYRNKTSIIEMLRDTVRICARLAAAILKEGLGSEALQAKVFDICGTLMSAHTNYHGPSKGDQQSKVDVVNLIWDEGIFAQFNKLLVESPGFWPGPAVAESFLSAFHQKMSSNPDKLNKVRGLVEVIMDKMVRLPDEIMKKAEKKDLIDLFSTMREKTKSENSKTSYWPKCLDFWMEFSQKAFVSSSSFVVKLYCWDLINEIIRYATEIKPPPSSYVVSGCKSPNEHINGEFKFKKYSAVGHPEYTLVTPKGEIFMFLCSINNVNVYDTTKKYDWFISLPDKQNPGTQKDIDYYHASSRQPGAIHPPSFGWDCVGGSTKQALIVVEPGPGLVPTADPVLLSKVLEWLNTQDIVEHVLGVSCHRELVKKSEQAFQLLLDSRAMSEEFVSALWRQICDKTDGDTTEQILEMVSALLPKFDESLIVASRSVICSKMNFSDDVNVWKLSFLLEKISSSQATTLQAASGISAPYAQFVLELLWIVFDSTTFYGKNYAQLPALLSKLLELSCAAAFRSQKIDVVMSALQNSYRHSDGVKYFTGLELLMRSSKVEFETPVFNKYIDILLIDLRKCVASLSASASSSAASASAQSTNSNSNDANKEGLKLRLKILRHFLQTSRDHGSLMENLSKVREILKIDFRINEYFDFLANFIQFPPRIVCDVYQNFVCDSAITYFGCAENEVYNAVEQYVAAITSLPNYMELYPSDRTFKDITAEILWKLITQSPAQKNNK